MLRLYMDVHVTVAQDEVRQDRAHGFAPRARETPAGEPPRRTRM